MEPKAPARVLALKGTREADVIGMFAEKLSASVGMGAGKRSRAMEILSCSLQCLNRGAGCF